MGSPVSLDAFSMLKVFFTVDVEIWCNSWQSIDAEFPGAFQRYIYGQTPRGDFGLPFQCRVLNDHGLTGVFFVEPLFSIRCGAAPLAEIVGLLHDARQEVQLHLHTEWVDELLAPLVPVVGGKCQYLRHFDLAAQQVLIGVARDLLARAGAPETSAFRAGSFGFNRDTLRALAALGIPFDTSYNGAWLGPESGVAPGTLLLDVSQCEGVTEYPVTVFRDGTPKVRPAQLTACSFVELEGMLWQAAERGYRSFTILSHSFEMLNPTQAGADLTVIDRFLKLCAFLDRHRDVFWVRGFQGLESVPEGHVPPLLESPIWRTGGRIIEQLRRRKYR